MVMATKTTKRKVLRWGEGSVRQRGEKFQARWWEDDKQVQLSGFASRAEAEEELKKIQHRLGLGQPSVAPVAVPKPRGRRFSDLLEDWIEHRRAHKVRSASEDRARWLRHLAPVLEAHTLDSVTPKMVRGIAADLVAPPVGSKGPDGKKKEAVSGPTAHRAITLLSAFYTWANNEEMTEANPARAALRNPATKSLLRSQHKGQFAPYLKSRADVDKLHKALKKIDGSVAVAYYISALAGLRPGEVVALRWGSVDLKACTIVVERQARKGYEGPTKSGEARTVPVVPRLVEALAAWLAAGVTDSRGVGSADLVCPPPPPNRRLQTGTRPGSKWGRYLGRVQIKDALASAFEATGIEPGTLYEYGRHTFGSLAALGGISTWRLKEIMGHADISTTERYVSLAGQKLTAKELVALGA